MTKTKRSPGRPPTTATPENAVKLYQHVLEHAAEGVSLTQLARVLGIPRVQAQKIANILRSAGLIAWDGECHPRVRPLAVVSPSEVRHAFRTGERVREPRVEDIIWHAETRPDGMVCVHVRSVVDGTAVDIGTLWMTPAEAGILRSVLSRARPAAMFGFGALGGK